MTDHLETWQHIDDLKRENEQLRQSRDWVVEKQAESAAAYVKLKEENEKLKDTLAAIRAKCEPYTFFPNHHPIQVIRDIHQLASGGKT